MFDTKRPISDNDALQTAPRVKRGSSGDVFVNWKDLRDDPIDGDQYFQKVDVNGEKQWGMEFESIRSMILISALGFLREWTVTSM